MATIEQLQSDFNTFQGDFATFVANVQAALAKVTAGGVTPEQQAALDTVDSGLTQMDAAIKAITFPT